MSGITNVPKRNSLAVMMKKLKDFVILPWKEIEELLKVLVEKWRLGKL